ncbi:methyltransferase [Microdochium trichocladiopsis]|uniref:Methyltransferase n=1 Tax=Microdochium trichocladiopsis TaxID=1682393 RepID=A0A9P8Y1D9_9PEZI|nr:methyltransferase [Microdochium trichocladiopsis]KAH7026720.1 methyltransferase [Microdochium trichocladiopsis]
MAAVPDNTDNITQLGDIKARLKASYDVIAPAYNGWTIPNSAQRLEYLDKLLALLPQLATKTDTDNKDPNNNSSDVGAAADAVKILELGCGCGVPITQKLLGLGTNVQVLADDISSTQIQLAKEALLADASASGRIQFYEGDMASLDIAPASLDAVLGLYSIFHLPRAEQPYMLAKIAAWLKPGGYFLGNFAGEDAEAVVFDKWLHDDGWMFYSGWGEQGTLDMVRKAGFEVVVGEVREDVVKAEFLWVIARKL